MTSGPYSRVYWSLVDDPMFVKVYDNPSALGTWLQMLLIADAMWPASAPMPPRNPTVRMLIACGLVIEKPANRYSLRGLQAEREHRSASGRNAAAVRWQSKGNADPMPRQAETSIDKTSNGANALRPQTFMGFQPKEDRSHHGQHGQECMVCFPPVPVKP